MFSDRGVRLFGDKSHYDRWSDMAQLQFSRYINRAFGLTERLTYWLDS